MKQSNGKSLTRKATAAMQDAINKVVEDHRRRHMPLAVWQDGRVVRVSPEQACLVREKPAAYKTRAHGKKT